VIPEHKKKSVRHGAVLGAVSGAAVAAVLYFIAVPSLTYMIFIPIGAIMGAAQMYVRRA